MPNTGCQRAPGFSQKMIEETLCKDLQDLQDWKKPTGIIEGTVKFTEAWDNACMNGNRKKVLEEFVLEKLKKQNPRENTSIEYQA